MRVKFLVDAGEFSAGGVHDLEPASAQHWLRRGKAELAEVPATDAAGASGLGDLLKVKSKRKKADD
jgi:hypothetical protein